MKAVKASKSTKAAGPKPAPRRRRATLQQVVIWAIIVLFSLSIVGGIIAIGVTLGR
ncbi:MAG TPA: hypothetical protein VNJ51_03930 [Candidatus Dormibacteraeota bacterium]|nr:hypothetical protein [Candidatus Dormibacteraeota bacterium]